MPKARRQTPEFALDKELALGPDAGHLDSSMLFKSFLRPDIEAEFKRWGWESTRVQNAIVFVFTLVGAIVYVAATKTVAARAVRGAGAIAILLATIRFIYVAWKLPSWTAKERVSHTQIQAAVAVIATTLNVALMSASAIVDGDACALETREGVATGRDVCLRSVRSSEAFFFFLVHRLTRNPMLSSAVTATVVLLFVFAASLSGSDFTSTDIAARQSAFLLLNALFGLAEVQLDRSNRQQFRSMLVLEDARRLHETQRDRLAYVVRRALPTRFANRLSRTMAHGSVLPLSELYDSASEATLCATAVTGFMDWSTKQLQESGVVALHRLFTLFDDATRIFGVDAGSCYGDTYYVTGRLIRGSYVRTSRIMRFALWQLHVRFGATDELPGGARNNSGIAGYGREPGAMTADPGIGDTVDNDSNPDAGFELPPTLFTSFDERPSASHQEALANPKLHSVVVAGPLAGGMTGSRELRYFLSGSALRRASEVLAAVQPGSLWASESAVNDLVSNVGDETGKFHIEPVPAPPAASELTSNVRGLGKFYTVTLKSANSETRRAGSSNSRLSSSAVTRGCGVGGEMIVGGDGDDISDVDGTDPYTGGGNTADDTEDLPAVEPDLADIAAAILGAELRDRGANPLAATMDMEEAGSIQRTFRSGTRKSGPGGDTGTMASYAATNIMSFVSRASTAATTARPVVDGCTGKLASEEAEAAFVFYASVRAARGYPYVGASFAAFFGVTLAITVPIRFAEGTYRGVEDGIAFVICLVMGVVSAVTAVLCRRHHIRLQRARAQAVRNGGGHPAAATEACQQSAEDTSGQASDNASPNPSPPPRQSPQVQVDAASGAGFATESPEDQHDNFDEFIFNEDPENPSSFIEPWLPHGKVTALCLLLLASGFAVLFIFRHTVITNVPLYFGLAVAPPVTHVTLPPFHRWQALAFAVVFLGIPNVAAEIYQAGHTLGPIIASVYYVCLIAVLALFKTTSARHLFHVAHYAFLSREAANRHSDVLGALLRRVVPAHVVKRGAMAVDQERELLKNAGSDALSQLRSAQLGDRVPKDPAVIDEFTDLAVIVVRLGPPDAHGVRFNSTSTGASPAASIRGGPSQAGSAPPAHEVSSYRGSVTFSEAVSQQPQNISPLDAARDVMLRWGRIAQVISMVGGTSLEHVQSVGDGFVIAGPFDTNASYRAVQRAVFAGMTVLGCLASDLNLSFTATCTVDEATGALVGRNALRYGIFGVSVRTCEALLAAVPPPPMPKTNGVSPTGGSAAAATVIAAAAAAAAGQPQHGSLPEGIEFDPGFLVGRGAAAYCTRSFVAAVAPSVAHAWSFRETEINAEDRRHNLARDDCQPPRVSPRAQTIAQSSVDVAGFPSADVFPYRPERWYARAVGIAYMWRLSFDGILDAGSPETLKELGFNTGESHDLDVDGEDAYEDVDDDEDVVNVHDRNGNGNGRSDYEDDDGHGHADRGVASGALQAPHRPGASGSTARWMNEGAPRSDDNDGSGTEAQEQPTAQPVLPVP